jgi:hypothetical protein
MHLGSYLEWEVSYTGHVYCGREVMLHLLSLGGGWQNNA